MPKGSAKFHSNYQIENLFSFNVKENKKEKKKKTRERERSLQFILSRQL